MRGSFEGAKSDRLQEEYNKLKAAVEKEHPHTKLAFKNLQPASKALHLHESTKQNAEMMKAINLNVEASPAKAQASEFVAWAAKGIDNKANECSEAVLNQLFLLIKAAPLQNRLPYVDLLRLIVLLHKKACLHFLQKCFEDFQDCLTSPASSALESGEKKIVFIFALILKVLANCFAHPEAASLIVASPNIYAMITYLLAISFEHSNASIVYAASTLSYNMMATAGSREQFNDECLAMLGGLAKGLGVEGLDDAKIFLLEYAIAFALYCAPKSSIDEMKGNKDFIKLITDLKASSNENIRDITADIFLMLG